MLNTGNGERTPDDSESLQEAGREYRGEANERLVCWEKKERTNNRRDETRLGVFFLEHEEMEKRKIETRSSQQKKGSGGWDSF